MWGAREKRSVFIVLGWYVLLCKARASLVRPYLVVVALPCFGGSFLMWSVGRSDSVGAVGEEMSSASQPSCLVADLNRAGGYF